MNKSEHNIIRTSELAVQLTTVMEEKHLGQRALARVANVNFTTVFRMLHEEYPGGVSRERGSRVIEAVTQDVERRIALYGFAGVPVYRIKKSGRLVKML